MSDLHVSAADTQPRNTLFENAFNLKETARHCPLKLCYDFPAVVDQKNAKTCVPLCLVHIIDWYLVNRGTKPAVSSRASSSTPRTRSLHPSLNTCAQMLY